MLNLGLMAIVDRFRYDEIGYSPKKIVLPQRLVDSHSKAWVGLESILLDIIEFSGIKKDHALEFGVEFGYSTSALANYFKKVTGVDIFVGDAHAGHYGDIYDVTKRNLAGFENIDLVRADYKDFIRDNQNRYDMVHVDIIHTYEDTFACGLWAARHSDCTIFHDTQSYPDVKRAVVDICKKTGKKFYNYRKHNGLGIVI